MGRGRWKRKKARRWGSVRLRLGGNGSLKLTACGSLNYSGAYGFKRRGPGRDGVNMGGRSGLHLRTLLVGPETTAERLNFEADLRWRVSCPCRPETSALPVHIRIMPEHILPERLIRADVRGAVALKSTHWLPEYQLELSGGFGGGQSSTTESLLYGACFHREARAHSAELGCRQAGAWVCGVG